MLPDTRKPQDVTLFKLNTPCSDMSIHHHGLLNDEKTCEDFCSRYRNVSCTITVVRFDDYARGVLSSHPSQPSKFARHPFLFNHLAIVHHLPIAKIALLLDSTRLGDAL